MTKNRVYWTSRKVGFNNKVGWIFLYKGKESEVYETRKEAQYALDLKSIMRD